MATFRVKVLRYKDGASDKVWAICRDGSRVMVFYGRYTQQVLNGGPIKNKESDLDSEVSRRTREQLAQGYVDLGEYEIKDKKIVWEPLPVQQAPKASRIIPAAYVGLTLEQIPSAQEALRPVFDVVEAKGRLVITLPGSMSMGCAAEVGEPTFAAFAVHGPLGILAVLAVGEAIKRPVFDQDHRSRDRNWLQENPEQFVGVPNLDEIAVALRLRFPPVKVNASAMRVSLW